MTTEAPQRRSAKREQEQLMARVQEILEDTCERDGQGQSLQEVARRKAYRAGINEALALLRSRRRD